MNRKSFLRNLIGSVAAVTVGAKLKPLAPVIAQSAAVTTATSSLALGRFRIGDLIFNSAFEQYLVVSATDFNGIQYTARPLIRTINGDNSITINSGNHTEFTQRASAYIEK